MANNSKALVAENLLATVVYLFSKHFVVSPKFLMKILPMLRREIRNFPFLFGIHMHGVSHPDAEGLLCRVIASGKIEREEFKEKDRFWAKPRIKHKLVSNISLGEMEAAAKQVGTTLVELERKVAVLSRLVGGNPENIEKFSIKFLINKFVQPTAWFYQSGRWETEKSSLKYKGLRQITIGPVSIPLPDFVRELVPLQRLIFKIYVGLLARKGEPNSEFHFRIRALKKACLKRNLSGEKVFLFGYILNVPRKLEGCSELFECTLSDSLLFQNGNRRVNVILDGSAQARWEKPPEDFVKYEVMALGTVAYDHIDASAILGLSELPEPREKLISENTSVTLLDFCQHA